MPEMNFKVIFFSILTPTRERERGLFNSDRIHAQTRSNKTTEYAMKFTDHR